MSLLSSCRVNGEEKKAVTVEMHSVRSHEFATSDEAFNSLDPC